MIPSSRASEVREFTARLANIVPAPGELRAVIVSPALYREIKALCTQEDAPLWVSMGEYRGKPTLFFGPIPILCEEA